MLSSGYSGECCVTLSNMNVRLCLHKVNLQVMYNVHKAERAYRNEVEPEGLGGVDLRAASRGVNASSSATGTQGENIRAPIRGERSRDDLLICL